MKFVFCEQRCIDLPGGSEHTEGYRQIIAAAIFRQVGWCEVDGDLACRKLEVGIDDGCTNTVLALSYRGFRQADDGEGRQAVGDVDFDGDEVGIDTGQCPGI